MTGKKQSFDVPISLEVGNRKVRRYYLNLNGYRNWNFHTSNRLKKAFKLQISDIVRGLDKVKYPCVMRYSIYYHNKRNFDIDNIGSVVAKFTHDALVEFEVLPDDNYHYIREVTFSFGGIDKESPRC